MAKKRATTKQVMELLRMGGMKLPAGLASKSLSATKAILRKEFEAGIGTRMQTAKLFGKLKGASPVDVNDPANKKALDGLLIWHKKLAGEALPFPKVPRALGGFFPGRISGTIVPPFDFADTITTVLSGYPVFSVGATRQGQLYASVVTAYATGRSGGSDYARVGFYFRPMSAGTLTIWSSPTYSFEWWTNSLNTSFVLSSGSVQLAVYGMDGPNHIGSVAGADYKSWDQCDTGAVEFDFAFDVQGSLSVQLAVDPSQIYLCFVALHPLVMGMGWPGSLAGAMASATVPSISYEFDPLVVAEP